MHNGSAVSLFWTIFVDEIEQNHAVLVYWSFVSHLQTPLIIIKICHSPDRDLWAQTLRAREWAQDSKARENVMHSVRTCGNEYNYY